MRVFNATLIELNLNIRFLDDLKGNSTRSPIASV